MPVSRGPEAGQRPDCPLWHTAALPRHVGHQLFAATGVHKQIGALFDPALTPEMKEVQKVAAARRLETLNQMLEGKGYLMGDRFTVVDAYLFTVLNSTRLHSISLESYPNTQRYQQRIAEREKVKQAMMEEGLLK